MTALLLEDSTPQLIESGAMTLVTEAAATADTGTVSQTLTVASAITGTIGYVGTVSATIHFGVGISVGGATTRHRIGRSHQRRSG